MEKEFSNRSGIVSQWVLNAANLLILSSSFFLFHELIIDFKSLFTQLPVVIPFGARLLFAFSGFDWVFAGLLFILLLAANLVFIRAKNILVPILAVLLTIQALLICLVFLVFHYPFVKLLNDLITNKAL